MNRIKTILNNIAPFMTVLFAVFLFLVLITITIVQIIRTDILLKNQTIVIIRTVGEKTQEKSIERLRKIFGVKNVYIIKNITPLADASKKTFELALANSKELKGFNSFFNKKWVVVVDSDVFFFQDKIILFIKKANQLIKKDKQAFCFQGLLFDKFAQNARMTGFYLYNLENLEYKNEYYNACKDKIRPEACIRDKIEKAGFNSYQGDIIVGIHDYFQYNKDIVKKVILHSKKNDIEVKDWIKNWQNLAAIDKDYQYAILGYNIYNSLNSCNFIPDSKKFDIYLKNYNIEENKEDISDKEINELLKKYNTQTKQEVEKIPFVKKIKPIAPVY